MEQDNRGFTLIEIMISLVVTLVVFLGLMQASLLAMDSNMRNFFREQAMSIAESEMSVAKNTPFTALASTPVASVFRDFRDINNFAYTTQRTVNGLGVCNVEVQIAVTWSWKQQVFRHSTTSIVRNPAC